MNKFRSGLFFILVFGLTLSQDATAGLFGSLFSKTITYKITVIDEDNNPIPAVTLWLLLNNRSSLHLGPDVMARLVGRYATSDNMDYVVNYQLHPSLAIFYADTKGFFEVEYQDNNIGNKKVLPISIAAIKRGYKATIISEETPVNSKRNLVLKLSRDVSARFDERLLKMDLLREEALNSFSLGMMSDARATLLLRINQDMRDLASTFEREGKLDEAAIVYHELAYLPSVDRYKDVDGALIIRGYTSGYDEKSPQRVADLNKSIKINQSNKQMAYEKILYDFFGSKRLGAYEDKDKYALRADFIAVAEAFLAKNREYIWPVFYRDLITAYDEQKDRTKACETLNRFYQFEPSYYDKKGWFQRTVELRAGLELEKWRELTKINPNIKLNEVSVDFVCEINGLQ